VGARAREAAGWAGQARRYLAGDPAVDLDADALRELVVALVTGMASDDERTLALELLRAATDEDLGAVFARGGGCWGCWRRACRPACAWSWMISWRTGSWAGGRGWPRAGSCRPASPRARSPRRWWIAPWRTWAWTGTGLDRDDEQGAAARGLIEAAIGQHSSQGLSDLFLGLPPVQQARATRWLTAVRVALHAHGTSPEVMATVDSTLMVLYGAAIDDVAGPDRLRLLTVRPPAGQAEALRRVLDPAPGVPGGPAEPFTGEGFRDQVAGAYRATIAGYIRDFVDGRRAEDRTPGRLHSMEQLGQMAALANQWADSVFGQMAARPPLQPDRDGVRGNIHDAWEDADERIRSLDAAGQRALAREALMRYLSYGNRVAEVMREYHAVPRFDPDGAPRNEEARVISEVIEALIGDEDDGTVAAVLDIHRGWPGRAQPLTNDIYIQVTREPEYRKDQQKQWRNQLTLVHENLHLLEDPQHRAYAFSLGDGSHAWNTLAEGQVSLWTEIVWASARSRFSDQDVRSVIEGEHARQKMLRRRMPRAADRRYPSMAEAVRLVDLVGDVRNLAAAYFLGDLEKITGPVGEAAAGGPAAPLTAGEVAALAGRLSVSPAAAPGPR